MKLCLNLTVVVILTAVGITDLKTMEIPDRFQVLLAGCGALSVFVFPEAGIWERILGLFCVSVPMALLCIAVEDAFGGGDIKLTAVMGFYLGWQRCLVGTAAAFFIGGIQASILLIRKRVKYGDRAHMAFGPALCAGYILAEFYGDTVFRWYLSFL